MPKRWKAHRADYQIKKSTSLAMHTLLVVFLLLFLGFAVNIFKNLQEPLSYRGFSKGYTWQGDMKFNVVIRADQIFVLSYDPEEQEVKMLNLADEIYLEVPGSFGSWQLRSIFDLGEGERQNGAELLSDAISRFLAAPMDGFIEPLGSLRGKSGWEMVQFLRSNPLNFIHLLGSSKMNLNMEEFMRLLWGVHRVRFDKIAEIDLKEEGLVEQKILPDGTLGLIGDPVKIDGFAGKIFLDSKLRKEAKTVAVFNATQKIGVAQKAATLISHLGGNVIFTTNARGDFAQSMVLTKQSESLTFKRLAQIFSPVCLREKCDILDDPEIQGSRADINVIIGSDLAN